MNSEEYEKAESVLSTALSTGYIDDPRINTSMTEVQGIISAKKQEQQQQEIEATLADIKTNCANDPVQMINNLKDLSSKYPDSSVVKDELASSKQSYKDSVMAGIDGVYASGGTGEVVNYLQTALDVMGPDGDVSAKLQEWKGHNKTIDLSTLDDFAHDCLSWRDTNYSLDYRTDSYGNVYDNILHAGWGGLSFIEYYIGDLNVRKLNFTAYLNKYGAQNAGEQSLSYMYIKVYGDDRLLYTFNSFYHTFEPTNMSVNVEGVKILRIETYKSTYMSMSNAYLSW